jgi:hypothetical protein
MNLAGKLNAERERAKDAWWDHRRWCGYCHTHCTTLCPLGKYLLNDYQQADGRVRALREAEAMAMMRLRPVTG